MKKLQSNYTTSEQSKRLLELGVPADSADCYYNLLDKGQDKIPYWRNEEELNDKTLFLYSFIKPCWSVGRLVEIYTECVKETETFSGHMILTKGWTVDSIIDIIAEDTELGCMDFSKLED